MEPGQPGDLELNTLLFLSVTLQLATEGSKMTFRVHEIMNIFKKKKKPTPLNKKSPQNMITKFRKSKFSG